MRQLKREVKIGNVTIGGNNPIAVQTMLNVPVEDIEGNVAQAKRCEAAGCQILRVTCPSAADAKCIEAVKNAVNIPIVADIHFDYKAALACADVGVDKIRINPGNIGDDGDVHRILDGFDAFCIRRAGAGHAQDLTASSFAPLCLRHIALNILHRHVEHRLHRNRILAADGHIADFHFPF